MRCILSANVLCCLLLFSGTLLASDLQLQLQLGLEHSDNLSVLEIETISERSDVARRMSAEMSYYWQPVAGVTVDALYQFSSHKYQQLSDYDLSLHSGFIDISYAYRDWTLGLTPGYSKANLAGESFMTLSQVGFYLARILTTQSYLRTTLTLSDKKLAEFSERSAQPIQLNTDWYWFMQQQRFIQLRLQAGQERANNSEYDYRLLGARLRYSHRFDWLQRQHRWQLSARAQHRPYRGQPETQSEARNDQHYGITAELNLGLSQQLSLITQLDMARYRSNLASADYRETRAAVLLQASF